MQQRAASVAAAPMSRRIDGLGGGCMHAAKPAHNPSKGTAAGQSHTAGLGLVDAGGKVCSHSNIAPGGGASAASSSACGAVQHGWSKASACMHACMLTCLLCRAAGECSKPKQIAAAQLLAVGQHTGSSTGVHAGGVLPC